MPGLRSGQATTGGLLHSTTMLAGCIFAVALVLFPFAWRQAGFGGLAGLAIAAGIGLASGLLAEALSSIASRAVSPLAGVMAGMAVRMLLPLSVCVGLAVLGHSGRQQLAFICYLLAFYAVTLVAETWLAVRRLPNTNVSNHNTR